MTDFPEKKACITGAGQSEVGRPSQRTALQLTADACLEAIADAGLEVSDIDGIATYPGKSPLGGGIGPVSPSEVQAVLGIRQPRWILSSGEGFSHMAPIFNAINAIACGMARHVIVFRSVAQATARMTSRESTLMTSGQSTRVDGNNAWTVPFNALSPINTFALYAQAYFDKYGATEEQLGAIAVNNRANAAHNPNAVYRKPLSMEDYLAARVISSPLRLFDCDSHIDGSTAMVVSHIDAAKDLKNPPLRFESIGMSIGGLWVGKYEGDFTRLDADVAGDMLWSRTDLKPKDVDCAQIYDGFSIHVWLWLEALGMVPRGEACRFVEGGSRIAIDGELPLNTGGGQLSAGRFHGYGHIHEATVQLWGRGGGRQVRDAKTCLVSNGGYGYGAMLLRRD